MGLLAFAYTGALVLTTFFTDLEPWGNELLLFDLAAAIAAVAAGLLLLAGKAWARALAVAAGVAGTVAGVALVAGAYPWGSEAEAVRNVAFLHVWAPVHALAGALAKPSRGRAPAS